MKDLLLWAPVAVRTSNMKISRRRLADYVKTLHKKACRTCSTIIFFSFNQWNHWFVALSLTLPSSNLKLPITQDAQCACFLGWSTKKTREQNAAANEPCLRCYITGGARKWQAVLMGSLSTRDGKRKRTFRVPGQWCLPHFYTNQP